MDNKAFKTALENLSKEKGISEEKIYESMELALTSAYKKNYKSLSNVRVDIDRDTGSIKVMSYKTVVDPNSTVEVVVDETFEGEEIKEEIPFPFDERIHLTKEEAQQQVPGIEIGETIEKEVTPSDFGRVAAATAKQVIIQKVREAERESINEEFSEKAGEMLVGVVSMEDERNYYIDLEKTQGILPKTEIIPGEKIKMGGTLKVYISKVDIGSKSTTILLSRTNYGFVKRLFELEIPEVNEGDVLIHNVVREPGVRTKIAVYTEKKNIDPIGSCIGSGGSRINAILKELGNEKIDIVLYEKDPAKFIANALNPAKDLQVFITNPDDCEALVIAKDEYYALAIGKRGVNAKLASRLTKYRIDIKTYEKAREAGLNIIL